MTEHQWKVELLTERVRKINNTRWPDGTYGSPTPEVEHQVKRAIWFLEGDELLRCECLRSAPARMVGCCIPSRLMRVLKSQARRRSLPCIASPQRCCTAAGILRRRSSRTIWNRRSLACSSRSGGSWSDSPLLRAEAKITADRITFPAIGATITAIASDYAGAAGGNQVIACFDELWGYTSERSRRLWDEMVPPPTRKIACRLTTTYAGFAGESELLELYKRGRALPQVGPDLHAGDGLLMFWSHSPVAPWQTPEWMDQMRRTMRPNAYLRMIENKFVTTESTFIDMACWDACVDPAATPVAADAMLAVYVGIDASVKHDSTAVVAVRGTVS
jgi:hypothetical protein